MACSKLDEIKGETEANQVFSFVTKMHSIT